MRQPVLYSHSAAAVQTRMVQKFPSGHAAIMTQAPDVAVLGAGIIGICAALSLQERGLKVELVDRDDPGQATSFGNAGVISAASFVPNATPGVLKKLPGWLLDKAGPVTVRARHLPRFIPWGLKFLAGAREERVREISSGMELLTRDCTALFRQHLVGTGHEDLIRDSHYIHAYRGPVKRPGQTLDDRLRAEAGIDAEYVDQEGLRALEPALSTEFKSALVIKGQARALSPGRLGHVLYEKFLGQGGQFRRAAVTSIKPRETGGWDYETDQGSHSVPKLVLAMGAWSAGLLKPLGLRVPLEAERGYHVCFTDPGITLNNSVMDVDAKFVASSMEAGLRAAGTSEFAGLDAPMSERRLQALIAKARRIAPDLNSEAYTTWSGQRPTLPDSLPCLGEVDRFPGLITAFGHSHWGLMMAPKTGRLVADIVQGNSANIDLGVFSPSRFDG